MPLTTITRITALRLGASSPPEVACANCAVGSYRQVLEGQGSRWACSTRDGWTIQRKVSRRWANVAEDETVALDDLASIDVDG